jgi:hypothetical protein
MNKSLYIFEPSHIGNGWGHYADIENNIYAVSLQPLTMAKPISIPIPSKNNNYNIEYKNIEYKNIEYKNIEYKNIEYKNIEYKNDEKKEKNITGFIYNINLSTCIAVSIIIYVSFFVV